ncbi:MAG: diaminopimelate decarboxylase [Oscillochloridaceae bacterium umkhey_bin13]
MMTPLPHSHIWPLRAEIRAGHLWIGGCDSVALAQTYGTPLYLLDEMTLRDMMRSYQAAFLAACGGDPSRFGIHYASKALLNLALAQLVADEGLGLDVVSGTELLLAQRADLPMAHVHLHGNAKSAAELQRAVAWGVGAIVVDQLDELHHLAALTANAAIPQGILLRVAPAIQAATHAHIATGAEDAKFGLPLAALDHAVNLVMAAPGLRLLGLHAHIGSQLFDLTQLQATVALLVGQAAHIYRTHGLLVAELSPGGGLGVAYTPDQLHGDPVAYAQTLVGTLAEQWAAYGLPDPLPRLTVEPGRSIVARAGVALYTVIGRKLNAAGQTQYLHLDGGMADNLRPALYGARYTAMLADQAGAPAGPPVTVAGRFCESGDVLLRDTPLPPAQPGAILAVATAGAYTLSMASNYNLVPRPALVLVGDGQARLIQRRESETEVLARDLPLR